MVYLVTVVLEIKELVAQQGAMLWLMQVLELVPQLLVVKILLFDAIQQHKL